ncbi:MAG: hypothetical protein ACD_76C00039G0002 [uncultured bacterium]|nr:MAG: hypothetical protein ACD_76C00039G0002 [uncultured bacterium]HBD05772.1 polyribonucleotide nucleotidyltransferase [Candidatus Uhrbacteria bacterium]
MVKQQTFDIEWGGRPLSIEVGKFAGQTNGSCVVRYGETTVLATAVMSQTKREGIDFFPLIVDYEEKLYAAGRIKGSRFIKQEGRPSDEAILTARFVDRAIRPLFDKQMRNEVQVIITVLSFDGINDPDLPALIGASCALHISDIPWNGPVGAIRIGKIGDEWVINPSYEALEKSEMDISFSTYKDKVIMIEAGAKESPENSVVEALKFGKKHAKTVVDLIEKVRKETGKEKVDVMSPQTDAERELEAIRVKVEELSEPFVCAKVQELMFTTPQAKKTDRQKQKNAIAKALKEHLAENQILPEHIGFGTASITEIIEREVSRTIVKENKRVDGRSITDVRELFIEVGVIPRVHGNGHFKRGDTQVLSTTTLGAPGDEQTLDSMETVGKKRYMHHYNFPPFSVGEVKPLRGPGRRDIGHGALAEKALRTVIPSKEEFPYTIRVVSEVLSSNGSSSMGATCGSTLALMDAGVPITAPVAGVAMGLAQDFKGGWKVITDLQDLEDGIGGMDFKITGTHKGITAIQMDTKTDGLTDEIIAQTFAQAKDGRLKILSAMEAVIAEPRKELSPYAPRIITIKIHPDKIREVIGPGGKIINEIIDKTGVTAIDIEQDGSVFITSLQAEGAIKAQEWIERITKDVEVGVQYKGKVTRLMDFGAFVEVLPGKEGLVHISEMAPYRVNKVQDIVKMDDEVNVIVTEIDGQGRTNLSMKRAEGNTYPPQPAQSDTPNADRGNSHSRGPRRPGQKSY